MTMTELAESTDVGGMIELMTVDSIDQRELAERLLEQAKEQNIELVGPDGLLGQLTKSVLETALDAEMSEHLGYDEANDPTTIGSATYAYNAGDELETRTVSKATVATYAYNEVGERTKTEPSSGPATTYGYDQAGNLTSVTRPKGTETAAIEDSYAYNGDGLRASQTISGTTSYFTWDKAEELPLLLKDGTNSYIYGPGGLPVEQINNTTSTVL